MTNPHVEKMLVEIMDKLFPNSPARVTIVVSDFLRTKLTQSFQEGKEAGMAEEADGCYKHSEQARKEGFQEGERKMHKRVMEKCENQLVSTDRAVKEAVDEVKAFEQGLGRLEGMAHLRDVLSRLSPTQVEGKEEGGWLCGKCTQDKYGVVGEAIPEHSRHCRNK